MFFVTPLPNHCESNAVWVGSLSVPLLSDCQWWPMKAGAGWGAARGRGRAAGGDWIRTRGGRNQYLVFRFACGWIRLAMNSFQRLEATGNELLLTPSV